MTDTNPAQPIQPFNTPDIRKAMLDAIAKAEAAGIDDATIDRMRLSCEFFTNQKFAKEMADKVWKDRI